MKPDIILEFAGGFVRPLSVADVHPGYVLGLNDPEVNRYLEVRHTVQTIQTVTEFIQYNLLQDDSLMFGIWQDDMSRHCGTIRLHDINKHEGFAHIGVCLFDKSAWGNKIGSKAVCKVTQWGFDELNLTNIEAGVYLDNISSQKTFLAAGYQWIKDVSGKFFLEGKPTLVKIYAARKVSNLTCPLPAVPK